MGRGTEEEELSTGTKRQMCRLFPEKGKAPGTVGLGKMVNFSGKRSYLKGLACLCCYLYPNSRKKKSQGGILL